MIFNYKWGTMDMKPTEKVWPAFVANSQMMIMTMLSHVAVVDE